MLPLEGNRQGSLPPIVFGGTDPFVEGYFTAATFSDEDCLSNAVLGRSRFLQVDLGIPNLMISVSTVRLSVVLGQSPWRYFSMVEATRLSGAVKCSQTLTS